MTHTKHNFSLFYTILFLLLFLISCDKNSKDIVSDYAGSIHCKPIEEYFEFATDLKPIFVRARYNLGLVYRDLNQLEKALLALTNAEKLNPNLAYIPSTRATILSNMDQLDEAKQATDKTLEIEPTDQHMLHLLGFITPKKKNPLNLFEYISLIDV